MRQSFGWEVPVKNIKPEKDMVNPVQRPRGPQGWSPTYAHLPWPSGVTREKAARWLEEYKLELNVQQNMPPKNSEPKKYLLDRIMDKVKPASTLSKVQTPMQIDEIPTYQLEDEIQEKIKVKKFLKFVPDAEAARSRSKDLHTKVGCVVLDDDFVIRSSGYNGFPRGVVDDEKRMERPTKYLYSSHAEENAIAQAARTGNALKDCTLIVTTLYPCTACTRMIIQAGIKRVLAPDVEMAEKWATEWVTAQVMMKEAGVHIWVYTEDGNVRRML